LNREGFLIETVSAMTSAFESVILNEKLAQTRGLLQKVDPRVKLFSFLLFIIISGLARSLWLLAVLIIIIAFFVLISRISPGFFLKRVLLFMPFTAIVAIPALFITHGDPAWEVGSKVIITIQGLRTASFLLLRVLDSISFGLLILMTTSWNSLLASLRWFRLPPVVIDIVGMTYRYIFLFLHTVNSLFLARRSRSLGILSGSENRRWLNHTLASTLVKTQYFSEEVYLSMLARGYQGEIYTINRLQFRNLDYFWLVMTLLIAAILIWSIYR